MKRKDAEREEARRLRAEGMSVKAIAREVGVAVSSVSVWVRDVALPPPREPAPPPPRPDPDEPTKYCAHCDLTLPISAFNRMGEGHQHWCRDCFRDYFRERGAKHREQSAAARDRRRAAGRELVLDHLRANPCADCGEHEIFVLEFDHCRGRKTAHVGTLIAESADPERIRAEIAMCDVVCVNCHRRRTAARAQTYRVTRIAPGWWTRAQRRNFEYLLDLLAQRGCIDCGEADPIVLEFDHLADKRANVPRLAQWSSLTALEAEIAKCEVRCANCHRLRTLAARDRCWRESDHWAAAMFIEPVSGFG